MSNAARRIATLLLALSLIAIGFAAGTTMFSTLAQPVQPVSLTVSNEPVALSAEEQTLANVYESVSPSVVAINAYLAFGAGSGSGFVIDQQGHIVTNYHVVQGAEELEVNFLDGTIVRAEVVGEDPDSDLAVVKVDLPAERLQPVTFGDSRNLTIGQTVVAIGSPFGQRWTMTSGIVSALERTIPSLSEQDFNIASAIQTDASINPGNSGGLLNLRGEVVGVNAQINTTTGSSAGVGFAIPSTLVTRVVEDLVSTGTVEYSYLGIRGGSINLATIEELSLPSDTRGVIVSSVQAGSPAEAAGLQGAILAPDGFTVQDLGTADIIVAINGEELLGFDQLINYLAENTAPGDTVTLTVLRDGQTVEVPVTLQPRPVLQGQQDIESSEDFGPR